MATIQTAIEMKDGVSSKLDKMAQSADGLGKKVAGAANAIEKTAQSAKNVAGSTEVAVNATKQYASATDSVTKATNGMASATKNTDEAMKKLSASVGGMYYRLFNMSPLLDYIKATASSAFGQFTLANMASSYIQKLAAAIAEIPSELIKMSDSYIGTLARIKLATSSQEEAVQMNEAIYQSALRARGSYSQMASNIAQVALIAKSAFPDPNEVVPFMEGIQKLFVINGTDSISQGYAMLQLKQALSAGKLQGDEFRSIAEAAPLIETMIADYLRVPQGALKKMGSDGLLTAEIVKNAILSQMDIINAKFETIPKRWMDLWQNVKTRAFKAFSPVLLLLNDFANTKLGMIIPATAIGAVELLSQVLQFALNNLVWLANTPVMQVLATGLMALASLANRAFSGILETIRAVGGAIYEVATQWAPQLHNELIWFSKSSLGSGLITLFVGLGVAIGTVIEIGAWLTGLLLDTIPTAINTLSDIIMYPFQLLYGAVEWACEGLNVMSEVVIPALLTVLTPFAVYWGVVNAYMLAHAAICSIVAGVQMIARAATAAWSTTVWALNVAMWLFHGSVLAVVAVVLLIVAAIAFGAIKIFGTWQNVTGNLGNTIIEVFESIGRFVAKTINFMVEKINGFIDVINTLAGAVNSVFGTNIKAVGQISYRADVDAFGASGRLLGQKTVDTTNRIVSEVQGFINDPQGKLNAITSKLTPTGGSGSYPIPVNDTGDAGNRTANNTGRMADGINALEEEIQDMKSFAEQEAMMYYTRQDINLGDINTSVTNNNGMDIDGVITHITDSLYEQLASSAEAVHV